MLELILYLSWAAPIAPVSPIAPSAPAGELDAAAAATP
jgi:hypothetical protein